ncbi:ABC transporter substrate-binding protein [Actinomadura terrae]|uniref:ABC transporter substrate-binding protein n=1 Tax=Actinomadura terrae TaxID=604353 RepID=UPI001FA6BE9E|nr:ABC transporter substrate-binding protein [Actinomadura terrae]
MRTVADLKGRNIGLASPDQDRAYLTAALRKAGLSIGDVDTTTVGPGSAAVARTLESGRIAAYAGTLTDFFAFDDAGLPVRDITPPGLEELPAGGYVVRTQTLENSDVPVRFFRALARGTYAGLQRPKAAEAAARQAAPEEWGEPEKARGLLAELSRTLAPLDGRTFGEIRPARWSNAQNLLLESGALEKPVDLTTLLATDVLQRINDFDRAATLATADAWLTKHTPAQQGSAP